MKWNNLKKMCCPKCGEFLRETPTGYECSTFEAVHSNGCATPLGCDFKIGKQKFDTVVTSIYKPKSHYSTPEDNLSALNNFGHEEYSKDYSDEIENL